MNFDPHKLAEKLLEHGAAWADANCAADLLEETKKTLRSQIALKHIPEVGSVAKAEMIAEASVEYIDHIRDMVEARRKANKNRVQYDADKSFIEMIRSQESSRRAELMIR